MCRVRPLLHDTTANLADRCAEHGRNRPNSGHLGRIGPKFAKHQRIFGRSRPRPATIYQKDPHAGMARSGTMLARNRPDSAEFSCFWAEFRHSGPERTTCGTETTNLEAMGIDLGAMSTGFEVCMMLHLSGLLNACSQTTPAHLRRVSCCHLDDMSFRPGRRRWRRNTPQLLDKSSHILSRMYLRKLWSNIAPLDAGGSGEIQTTTENTPPRRPLD